MRICKFSVAVFLSALVASHGARASDHTDLAIVSECHETLTIRPSVIKTVRASTMEGRNVVNIWLNAEYLEKLKMLSRDCVGEPICFVWKGEDQLCPIVREVLIGGALMLWGRDEEVMREIAAWANP